MCVLVSERFDSTEPCAESALRRSVHQHMRQQSWYLSTYVVDGDEDEFDEEADEPHDDEPSTCAYGDFVEFPSVRLRAPLHEANAFLSKVLDGRRDVVDRLHRAEPSRARMRERNGTRGRRTRKHTLEEVSRDNKKRREEEEKGRGQGNTLTKRNNNRSTSTTDSKSIVLGLGLGLWVRVGTGPGQDSW